MKHYRPTRPQLRRELAHAALLGRIQLAQLSAWLRAERELITVLGTATLMLLALGAAIMLTSSQRQQPTPPTPAAPAAPAPTPFLPVTPPSPPTSPPAWRTRVVAAGETLAGIALREGVPLEQIAADSGVTRPNRIATGQVLRLSPRPAGIEVIRPGRTLTSYARQTGLSLDALRGLNPHLSDPDQIIAGGQLRVGRR